jgi:AcrR family transcriptional regulator
VVRFAAREPERERAVAERTKGQRTEEDLKNAARRLLVSKSYAEIKVTDITAEAGKAAGVFYRYFTDKNALLRALAADFEQALHSPEFQRFHHDLRDRQIDTWADHILAACRLARAASC